MTDSSAGRGRALLRGIALALLLAALPVLCSASSLSAKRENMSINWAPVVVAYEPSATAQDVMLPLPEGAETVRGFRYTIDTKEGEPVLRYASVVVTTRESAERIAAEYTSKLPGKPRAELVEDKAGKRLVLAVGDEEEVRTVTIFENGRGARVELVRVVQGAVPQGTPPEAQVVPRQPMPRGPMMRRGRRGGMRV